MILIDQRGHSVKYFVLQALIYAYGVLGLGFHSPSGTQPGIVQWFEEFWAAGGNREAGQGNSVRSSSGYQNPKNGRVATLDLTAKSRNRTKAKL
ncbi:hypothetical protein GTA51_16995 [Desulfovibrio aerotolerans]|uniref:Uncharacterized protein n=1 Tax=Solidesulfovibrio aerotolerans TaxID=295255 RepID=A0A7C9MMQ6_9BACT|nr:hypothetical protein [Solidesulfovibrio aerotolerans]MYL84813.1 hypothetical protein [Solidesulfovibrio aerotolerans]